MSDIEKCYNVKARRSLCVLGITDNDTDDDIIATFEKYGVIVKVVRVAPSTGQTEQSIIIVEFDAYTPVTAWLLGSFINTYLSAGIKSEDTT